MNVPSFFQSKKLVCELCDNAICGNDPKELFTAWSFNNMQVCESCWIDLETK